MSKDKLSDDDIELFRKTVGTVKKLDSKLAEVEKKRPKAIPQQLKLDEEQVLTDMLSEHYTPEDLNLGEELSFQRPGIQNSVLRKLKRGQYSIEAELDLHGLTVAEARPAVTTFLHSNRMNDVRCVKIIHGKGRRSSNKGPILKPMVNKWLTQLDEVLAFCSAKPADGGTGAVYVLLKKT